MLAWPKNWLKQSNKQRIFCFWVYRFANSKQSLNKVEDEEPIKCSDLSKGRYWVIGEGKDKEKKGSLLKWLEVMKMVKIMHLFQCLQLL